VIVSLLQEVCLGMFLSLEDDGVLRGELDGLEIDVMGRIEVGPSVEDPAGVSRDGCPSVLGDI
jgi:hypothetical protein